MHQRGRFTTETTNLPISFGPFSTDIAWFEPLKEDSDESKGT
jgi:hypothetical protein